ncbi:MAG: M48 family metalloprotease [Methanosarcinaceae archaeon]|nr:M48 family metalloprotease [Methanosarcinaceae archaeon]
MYIKHAAKIIPLFALPAIPILAIAWFLGGTPALAGALVMFALISYTLYRFSGRILIKWYHARKIGSVDNLASKAGVTAPDMYMFESSLPSIFTVGTNGQYTIVLSTGAMGLFDESGLGAMLAREIGHIRNGDVPLNTIVALFAGTIAAFSTAALWGSLLTGFGQDHDPAPRFIRFLAMGLAAPPAALLVQLLVARSREYAADDVALELTGKPRQLVECLARLKHHIDMSPAGANPGHVHMFPINVLRVTEWYDTHLSLFDTHPNLEGRVDRLMEGINNG